MHDTAMDVGEAKLQTLILEGRAFVIDALPKQDGRLQIVTADPLEPTTTLSQAPAREEADPRNRPPCVAIRRWRPCASPRHARDVPLR